MQRRDFSYELPPELIASTPTAQRTQSRLLQVDGPSGAIADLQFRDLPTLLRRGDLLVRNNTRVLPARLFGRRPTGGRVEIMLERMLDAHCARVQMRASKALRAGSEIRVDGGAVLVVTGRDDGFYVVRCALPLLEVFREHGHIPLPPYIERADVHSDRERYQTVYAQTEGSVAAPTAGLHFDNAILHSLRDAGIDCVDVTLHVGAGTYQPVRVDDIAQHTMHSEWCQLGDEVVSAIAACRARGGRVIAVGTTSARTLESAALDGKLKPISGETDIFITPGYRFQVVDGLITNFHLPESTLLMMVSALAGTELIRRAYAHAISARYRFYSYGDAMLIWRA